MQGLHSNSSIQTLIHNYNKINYSLETCVQHINKFLIKLESRCQNHQSQQPLWPQHCHPHGLCKFYLCKALRGAGRSRGCLESSSRTVLQAVQDWASMLRYAAFKYWLLSVIMICLAVSSSCEAMYINQGTDQLQDKHRLVRAANYSTASILEASPEKLTASSNLLSQQREVVDNQFSLYNISPDDAENTRHEDLASKAELINVLISTLQKLQVLPVSNSSCIRLDKIVYKAFQDMTSPSQATPTSSDANSLGVELHFREFTLSLKNSEVERNLRTGNTNNSEKGHSGGALLTCTSDPVLASPQDLQDQTASIGNITDMREDGGSAALEEMDIDGVSQAGKLSRTQIVVISTCSTIIGIFFLVAAFLRIRNYIKRSRMEQELANRPKFRSCSVALRGTTQSMEQLRRDSLASKVSHQTSEVTKGSNGCHTSSSSRENISTSSPQHDPDTAPLLFPPYTPSPGDHPPSTELLSSPSSDDDGVSLKRKNDNRPIWAVSGRVGSPNGGACMRQLVGSSSMGGTCMPQLVDGCCLLPERAKSALSCRLQPLTLRPGCGSLNSVVQRETHNLSLSMDPAYYATAAQTTESSPHPVNLYSKMQTFPAKFQPAYVEAVSLNSHSQLQMMRPSFNSAVPIGKNQAAAEISYLNHLHRDRYQEAKAESSLDLTTKTAPYPVCAQAALQVDPMSKACFMHVKYPYCDRMISALEPNSLVVLPLYHCLAGEGCAHPQKHDQVKLSTRCCHCSLAKPASEGVGSSARKPDLTLPPTERVTYLDTRPTSNQAQPGAHETQCNDSHKSLNRQQQDDKTGLTSDLNPLTSEHTLDPSNNKGCPEEAHRVEFKHCEKPVCGEVVPTKTVSMESDLTDLASPTSSVKESQDSGISSSSCSSNDLSIRSDLQCIITHKNISDSSPVQDPTVPLSEFDLSSPESSYKVSTGKGDLQNNLQKNQTISPRYCNGEVTDFTAADCSDELSQRKAGYIDDEDVFGYDSTTENKVFLCQPGQVQGRSSAS